MSEKTLCKICRKISHHKCGNCHNVFYCTKFHQKLDWINHKPKCFSYKVIKNDVLGRHLVSNRIISEGEVIIKESPIITGPSQAAPSVCLGCYDLLTKFNVKECSLCGLPICSEECEKSLSHRPECQITCEYKKSKVKINLFQSNFLHPSYHCFAVLRCLFLKKNQPELWKKLMNLESHYNTQKSTKKCSLDELLVVDFITHFFNYSDFSKDEILKVMGIIQVNAHEVPLKEPGYIAIYEKASFLEHSCRANCMKSFTNSGDIVIRAAEKILPGDHISICYTDPLWGREMRMRHLLQTKFFICHCIRCVDPSEMGTHFNSIRCLKRNCKGFVTPPLHLNFLYDKVKCPNSNTTCQECNKVLNQEFLIREIDESFSKLNKKDEKSCMDFLKKYEPILNQNHYIIVRVKLLILELIIRKEKLITLENNTLNWAIKACENLSFLATTLVPAENRLRGILKYQFYLFLSESDRRSATKAKSVESINDSRNISQKCHKVLEEAYNLLQYEPCELPEGKMAIEVKKALSNLQKHKENE